jgi:hypothetical protein
MKANLKISQIAGTEECIPCNEAKAGLTTLCPKSSEDIYRNGVTFGDLVDILKRNEINPLDYDESLCTDCVEWINIQINL